MTPVPLTSRLRALLIVAGRAGRPLAYSEYAALLGLNPRSWPHLQRVIRALKSIMLQDHRCGRPYAAVAAVSLGGDTAGLPGKGFARLARQLGRFSPHEDYRAFVVAEWQRFRAHCLALPALQIA
jgi:hypothetical protein